MFARSSTETADRGLASSATHAVVNNSDAVPSSLADGQMPMTNNNNNNNNNNNLFFHSTYNILQ